RPAWEVPSVVPQNIDPSELLHGSLHEPLSVLFLVHIRPTRQTPSARLLRHLGGDMLQQLLAAGADGDIRPLARQPKCRGLANPLTASRDQSDPPLQPQVHAMSP